jgi:hypothetical protein
MGVPDTSWARYDVVSGRFQGHNRFGNEKDHRFAYRLRGSFVVMDDTWQNGALCLGTRAHRPFREVLVVDGMVAAEVEAGGPGHTRLLTILEQGFGRVVTFRDENGTRNVEPAARTRVEYEGRAAERRTYEVEGDRSEVVVDLRSRLPVRIRLGDEVADLTNLSFDDDVDLDLFEPPDAHIEGWRGGTAFLNDGDGFGEGYSATWEATSGPGHVGTHGPSEVSRDEVLEWAFARTDRVLLREGGSDYQRMERPN